MVRGNKLLQTLIILRRPFLPFFTKGARISKPGKWKTWKRLQNLELTITDKQFKMEKQLVYLYMTFYLFVKNAVIFLWRLLEIWRSCRLSIIFTNNSRSSSLSNWWVNRMPLSITYKVSEADLILSGSSIYLSTSSLFDTSINSSAGFSCF